MITVFKENDVALWIPVANGKNGGAARAFLPFKGVDELYTYGYKADPSREKYFDALREIQRAFIVDEVKTFQVNGGNTEEKQKKAKWRDGNNIGSSLLGPTLGWAKINIADIGIVSGAELGKAIVDSGSGFVVFTLVSIEAVLCETFEQLEEESAKLRIDISGKKPIGQASPLKILGSVEHFVRDAAVVAYVLNEAAGRCESCCNPAPFVKPNGEPYLEVHHVKPLAAKGSDRTTNAVAICPNCHRELHSGSRSNEMIGQLYLRLPRLVPE